MCVCGFHKLFILTSGQDGEISSGYFYRVATTKLTIVSILAIIRILVIEYSGYMFVLKGLHLATSVKSPNGFYLELIFRSIEI
jgi:hypothetical protein